ncbi:tRNA (guanine-N(7)-)-methyltransferase non-catalytic subunit wdr4 [Trichogramma pretiosum]|uniref:tRNA (guanine-N(7)-)-methyltransferase non-catalytic subunit wdr4 n=1 Tax=Trichogramma pretiosum TaxID=7493 RepID=UPI0006C95179|nr:tRNA (guanine-N(7)-)-methyltransferase non-catalytic subunit wdr4 [Trichogramma pretiosum]
MSFAIHDSVIVMCSGNNVSVYNLETKEDEAIILPKLEGEKEIKAHNREDIESFHALTRVSFSSDGQYFFICTNRKQLCLYRKNNFELISNRTMSRAASSVKFLPNNDIVVADKSGDVYLFSTSSPSQNGHLLFGHLSMLLDIAVTNDQKYIISADRDEKIRISMYPNCYNIVSYCLGHKNFVTNVGIISHHEDIMISSGGDGMLMFWDYKKGNKIFTTCFHEKLLKNDLLKLSETLKENDLDIDVTVSPVKIMQLLKISNQASLIILTFYCSNNVLIYKVSNGMNDLKVDFVDTLVVDTEPMECHVYENKLWILLDSTVQIFKLQESHFIYDDQSSEDMNNLNKLWNNVNNVNVPTLLPVLYKRKFDNVQEYQEKKKARLIK